MKRTYVDILGDYYDNLDQAIDLSDESDRRFYNLQNSIQIESI